MRAVVCRRRRRSRCRAGGRTAGVEGVRSLLASGLLRAVLLQHEERPGLQKGRQRHAAGDVRD